MCAWILRSARVCVGLSLAMAGTSASSFAAEIANAQARAGEATTQAQEVADIHLAAELAEWGRRSRSAPALIEAAKILARTGGKDRMPEKTEEGPTAVPPKQLKLNKSELSVSSLLQEAGHLAGPDQYLQKQIEQAASAQSKGDVGDASVHIDTVKARTTDVYHIKFRGGYVARIAIKGDGDTPLSLYVYDQNGYRVCADTGTNDRKFCQWTPRWTGTFTVKISNEGDVYNRYTLATN